MTRFYVDGHGVTYIHKHERSLSSTKCSVKFAEIKNDKTELEVWRPWMFFGGTDTNLMEELEILLDAHFTVKCSTVLCTTAF